MSYFRNALTELVELEQCGKCQDTAIILRDTNKFYLPFCRKCGYQFVKCLKITDHPDLGTRRRHRFDPKMTIPLDRMYDPL